MSDNTDIVIYRQQQVYGLSTACSTLIVFLWLPIILQTEHGSSIRPMIQLPATIFIVLPFSMLGIFMACKQLFLTWPRKIGFIAIFVSLIPLFLYLFSQWWLFRVACITYGD